MIKTRSVWSDIRKDDGLRILATRFRGRGLPTSQVRRLDAVTRAKRAAAQGGDGRRD